MSTGTRIPLHPVACGEAIPPLEQGDRLTRDEFERRYNAMPKLKKAELIEGMVHIPAAVRWRNHAVPHADLIGCMVVYRASTPGVKVYDNPSIRLGLDNEPQPDATMLIEPASGGQTRLSDDDLIEGAPELIAEVSSSSVSIDLNAKLRVYCRNGVREYLVWRVHDREIDQFVLRDGRYDQLPAAADGILRSEQFPGLWLDRTALIRGDVAAVLTLLQQGLVSAKHREFVNTLAHPSREGVSFLERTGPSS